MADGQNQNHLKRVIMGLEDMKIEDHGRALGDNVSEWRDYQNLVLHELERLNENIEKIMDRQNNVALEVNTIKTRAKAYGMMFGLVAGFVGSAIIVFIESVLGKHN